MEDVERHTIFQDSQAELSSVENDIFSFKIKEVTVIPNKDYMKVWVTNDIEVTTNICGGGCNS